MTLLKSQGDASPTFSLILLEPNSKTVFGSKRVFTLDIV
jgi:hypothetical protein